MPDYRQWSAISIDLASIQALSEDERCYRFSDQARAALLSVSHYLKMLQRWDTPEPLSQVQRDWVFEFASYVQSRLMDSDFCAGDAVIDVRQNPEEPCLLEKSTDGGVTWEMFADLRLCMPRLRRSPLTGHYQWTTDDITFYDFPDGPYTGNKFPETLPPAREDTETVNKCDAAANGAQAIRRTYGNLATSLFDAASDQFDLFETILDGLLTAIGLNIPLLAYGVEMAALLAFQAGFDGSPMTDDDETTLKCILFNHATDTAGVVTFDYSAVLSDVSGHYLDMDGMQWGLLALMLPFLGNTGLNLAGGVTGLSGADCTTCDETPCAFETGFTTGIPSQLHPMGDFPFTPPFPAVGAWSASGGHDDAGSMVGTLYDATHNGISGYIDLLEDCNVSGLTLWIKSGNGTFWKNFKHYNEAGTLLRTVDQGDGATAGVYVQRDELPSAAVKRYIVFYFQAYTGGQINIDDITVVA